jgi:hypothetical protein
MTTERSSLPQSGRPVLRGLLDLRPSIGAEPSIAPGDDAVAQGLAVAKVYAFASVDFPGAAESLVFDSDGTTAVGGFTVDPGSNTPLTAFTFTSGTYEILPFPSSTLSLATGINASGLIVGAYQDRCVLHGFANTGGAFSNDSQAPAGLKDRRTTRVRSSVLSRRR